MAARLLILVALIALVAAAPLFAPWSKVILTVAIAKGLAVLGIVVLLQAGQVSFGHAMFFATGAYTAAFLGRWFGEVDILLAIATAAVMSALLGLAVGLFVVRYRYIFFGMLNLAFSMVLFSILEKFFHVTGGSDGIRIARPLVFGAELEREVFETGLFYGSLAFAAAITWLVWRYLDSPLGQALKAIKTNETRLEYLGISARGTLLVGYVASAVLCGLGGVLLGIAQGLATPEFAFWIRSGEFVFIAILGGAQNVLGAFAGSLVYELVRTYAAAFFADAWQLILGVILLAIILFSPGGLVGIIQSITRRPEPAEGPAARKEPAE